MRQRTDEVLLDIDNVVLGHAAKMRWNPADQWLFSEQIAHPPITCRCGCASTKAVSKSGPAV